MCLLWEHSFSLDVEKIRLYTQLYLHFVLGLMHERAHAYKKKLFSLKVKSMFDKNTYELIQNTLNL